MESKEIERIYSFIDAKPTPDIIHPYQLEYESLPIVIDNGSYQARVGWASDPHPRLVYRNCYAKYRKDRGKKIPVQTELLVGNDITNIEAVRFQLKSPHEDGIVTNFQAQETVLDYSFKHLNIQDSTVSHPIVMTEPFLNINYCRGLMSELLFECYGVPKVAYCVDSLSSYALNCAMSDEGVAAGGLPDGLIVNIGNHHITVMPCLDGAVLDRNCRRIKIGGQSMTRMLWKWLQLQYPHHSNAITLSRAEELLHNLMWVSSEFNDDINSWGDGQYYEDKVHHVQLPFVAPVVSVVDPNVQKERRREAARRLVEMNAKKRGEKLAEDEAELSRLTELLEALEEFTACQPEFNQALEEAGAASKSDLVKTVNVLRARVKKSKAKLNNEEANKNEGGQASGQKAGSVRAESPVVPVTPVTSEYLNTIKEEWSAIQQKRANRRNKRQDMAKRRTVASQERMRIISLLAKREKKDDNFGRRDEDWDVYKAINKEGGGSDSEEEADRLQELQSLLKQHCPEFLHSEEETQLTTAQRYQLHLSTELIRTGELLFQPSLVGLEQGGLSDTLEYVLKLHSSEEQMRLSSNVFITGGASQLPGFVERVTADLRAMRPFESSFRVRVAQSPSLDAWKGARSHSSSLLEECGISREEYLEQGGERIKHHFLGNRFWKGEVVVQPPP